jgi:hypothetical protein
LQSIYCSFNHNLIFYHLTHLDPWLLERSSFNFLSCYWDLSSLILWFYILLELVIILMEVYWIPSITKSRENLEMENNWEFCSGQLIVSGNFYKLKIQKISLLVLCFQYPDFNLGASNSAKKALFSWISHLPIQKYYYTAATHLIMLLKPESSSLIRTFRENYFNHKSIINIRVIAFNHLRTLDNLEICIFLMKIPEKIGEIKKSQRSETLTKWKK